MCSKSFFVFSIDKIQTICYYVYKIIHNSGDEFMKNRFEQATADDLKNGYAYDNKEKAYFCLFCNIKYSVGDIYKFDSRLVDAEKAIQLHTSEKHQSVFEALLSADKKQTGLTDTQKEFLMNFYGGLTDKEVAETTETSPSTVRFQRHSFREKAKQAKFILAISDLLEEKIKENIDSNIKTVKAAKDGDEAKMSNFFESESPLVLKFLSVKQKNRLFIFKTIAKQFETGKKYTEKQVNEILKPIYGDYVTIRRELIDYGFMERTSDCREYWLKS